MHYCIITRTIKILYLPCRSKCKPGFGNLKPLASYKLFYRVFVYTLKLHLPWYSLNIRTTLAVFKQNAAWMNIACYRGKPVNSHVEFMTMNDNIFRFSRYMLWLTLKPISDVGLYINLNDVYLAWIISPKMLLYVDIFKLPNHRSLQW